MTAPILPCPQREFTPLLKFQHQGAGHLPPSLCTDQDCCGNGCAALMCSFHSEGEVPIKAEGHSRSEIVWGGGGWRAGFAQTNACLKPDMIFATHLIQDRTPNRQGSWQHACLLIHGLPWQPLKKSLI